MWPYFSSTFLTRSTPMSADLLPPKNRSFNALLDFEEQSSWFGNLFYPHSVLSQFYLPNRVSKIAFISQSLFWCPVFQQNFAYPCLSVTARSTLSPPHVSSIFTEPNRLIPMLPAIHNSQFVIARKGNCTINVCYGTILFHSHARTDNRTAKWSRVSLFLNRYN